MIGSVAVSAAYVSSSTSSFAGSTSAILAEGKYKFKLPSESAGATMPCNSLSNLVCSSYAFAIISSSSITNSVYSSSVIPSNLGSTSAILSISSSVIEIRGGIVASGSGTVMPVTGSGSLCSINSTVCGSIVMISSYV